MRYDSSSRVIGSLTSPYLWILYRTPHQLSHRIHPDTIKPVTEISLVHLAEKPTLIWMFVCWGSRQNIQELSVTSYID